MKKKILSIGLATAMLAGLATGCGSSNSGTTAAAGGSDSTQAATEAQPSSKIPINNEGVDTLKNNTSGNVALTVWASEEDQEFTQKLIDEFKAQYSDVTFDIKLGACSEADTKDTVLKDVEAAADVFAYADDQTNELVKGGGLQEITSAYTYDVVGENVAGAIEAATLNDKLYAYPMTADNGYFLYYDSSVFSDEDVKSLDKMVEVAGKAGKQIGMCVSNAWYNYAFFKGAGLDATLAADGVSTECNWNAKGGTDVAQAIIDLGKTGTFVNCLEDADIVTGVKDGKFAAVVSGVWNAQAIESVWGANYNAGKLPTFKCGGKDVQMSSFSGYKLVGVNPHSKQVGWAMILAEFLTNEKNQIARFEARGLGPANIKAASSDKVKQNKAIAALAAQADFATPQRVGGNYWEPANTLGLLLITGNPDGTDLQTLLDNAVAGITAPVN